MAKRKGKRKEITTRFCSRCQCVQSVDGGQWIVSVDGLKRRWHCGKHFQASNDENGSSENNKSCIIDNQPEIGAYNGTLHA